MDFARLHLRWILLGLPVPRPTGGLTLPVHTLMHGVGPVFKKHFRNLSRGSGEGLWVGRLVEVYGYDTPMSDGPETI